MLNTLKHQIILSSLSGGHLIQQNFSLPKGGVLGGELWNWNVLQWTFHFSRMKNLEDTHWGSQMFFPFLFCLAGALPWVTPKVWRVPKTNPPLSLCLGQALISGTPYSSCDMHTIHKNSLICIPDSYQASQYSPTWLMCQLPSTWLYASFN